MCEGAESPSRTVAGILDVVAFGRLVDFRMKLLFCTGVTILAIIAGIAGRRITPLVPGLDVRARG